MVRRQGRQPDRCYRTQARTRSRWSLNFVKSLTALEVGSTRRAARLARRLLGPIRRDLAGLAAAVGASLPLRPGLYVYRLEPQGGTRRIHLRVAADRSALLLVDVTDAIHLNPTAALLAKAALDGRPISRAIGLVKSRFHGADTQQIESDARRIFAAIEHLATTTERCPTCGLFPIDRLPPFTAPVSAPYKADLALGYGCNNACRHCYNEPERIDMRPLATGDWHRVLEKLAAIGIPHVIFTGGEPTLADSLEELIHAADRLGLVTGLNTNGRRLADAALPRSLAAAGLGHVQVTLQSTCADVHNAMAGADAFDETVRGVRNSLDAGLHTITNTTLTQQNIDQPERLVEFLHSLGLKTFAANGMIHSGSGRDSAEAIAEEDLGPVLVRLRDRAAELGMRMLWYTPTAYCRLSPVELELGPRRCNAAEYSICIEPNGDVLPCQSYYEPAGNILTDRWETIWNGRLFESFRCRIADPRGGGLDEECWDCPDLSLCGGGCPLQRNSQTLVSIT